MNLKDAFRYQNTLTSWIDKMSGYLMSNQNTTKKTQEHLRSKANPDAKDETMDMSKEREYPYEVNKLVDFLISLLDEKTYVSNAINFSKRQLPIDMDSSVALNKKRQEIKDVLNRMSNIKSSERITRATDYKFNNEGNQTSYMYEVKEIVVIDFDRNKTKAIAKKLSNQCDDISNQLDKIIIDTIVEFNPQYDVNDGFEEVLERYINR